MIPTVILVVLQGSPVRAQLEAKYKLFSQAWARRDLSPTYSMMTGDFTATGMTPDGKSIGRDAAIAQTKPLLVASDISWPRKIVSVSAQGLTAVATVEGHFSGLMPGQNGAKPQRLELFATTRDTWVKVGSDWKFKRMEIVKSSTKIDSKPMKR